MKNRLAQNFLLKLETETKILQEDINVTIQILDEIKSRPLKRPKRAILPFVGQIFQTVIGTATTSDIDEIMKHITSLQNSQKEVLHILEQGASVLNQTTIEVSVNRKAINKLTEFTQSLDKKFASLSKLVLSDLVTFTNIGNDMDLIFQSMHTAFKNIRECLSNLNLHYSLAKNGILPRSLFPPQIFQKALEHIQDNLPKSVALPFKPEQIEKYYSITHTTVSKTSYGFMVHVKVPIVQVQNLFYVYQILSIPVPQIFGESVFAASYNIGKSRFIAISDDKSKFITLEENEIQTYLRNQIPFCPFRKPIMNTLESEQCLPAMLTQRENHVSKFCEKKIHVNHTDIPDAFYLGNGHWIIIAPRTLSMEISCTNNSFQNLKKSLTGPLELLSLDPGCSASCRYFQLPKYHKADSLLPAKFDSQVHSQLAIVKIWNNVLSELSQDTTSVESVMHSLPPLPDNQATLSEIKTHLNAMKVKHPDPGPVHLLTTVPSTLAAMGIITIMVIVFYKIRPQCMTRHHPSGVAQNIPIQPILSGSEDRPTSANQHGSEQPDEIVASVKSMLTRTSSHAL